MNFVVLKLRRVQLFIEYIIILLILFGVRESELYSSLKSAELYYFH